METSRHNIGEDIKQALAEVEVLMRAAFDNVNGVAPVGSAFDQAGLHDGGEIVRGYLSAGEAGLALEHLIYMTHEPKLPISHSTYSKIESAGSAMKMDHELWECIRPASE